MNLQINENTENKIDYLIEEAEGRKNFAELNTIQKRALATAVKNLKPEELKRLRKISTRLKIAAKNGLIDGTMSGALFAAIGGALGGPIGAAIGGGWGAAVGAAAGAGHNYNKAKNAADLQAFGGPKEVKELQKEFKGMFGDTISKLISFEGKVRLGN